MTGQTRGLNAHLRNGVIYALTSSAAGLQRACTALTPGYALPDVRANLHVFAANEGAAAQAGDEVITTRGDGFTLLCAPQPGLSGDEFMLSTRAPRHTRSLHQVITEIDLDFLPSLGHAGRRDTTASLSTISLLLAHNCDAGGLRPDEAGFTMTVHQIYEVSSPDPVATHDLFCDAAAQDRLHATIMSPFESSYLRSWGLSLGEIRRRTAQPAHALA